METQIGKISTQLTALENSRSEDFKMVVNEECGPKETKNEGGNKLKYHVSKSNPSIRPIEEYKKRERKVDKMQVLLETLKHINVTLPLFYHFLA